VGIKPLFEVTAATPEYCSSNMLGLCVIAFLDGGATDLAAQLAVLQEAQQSPSNKGRVTHFMWVDATCHPNVAEAFGASLDLLPSVVAVSPKKGKMANMLGRFERAGIDEFVGSVLHGRQPLVPLVPLPSISESDDCAAAHAATAEPPTDDDFDLADILA
jgi:hypothetical protein